MTRRLSLGQWFGISVFTDWSAIPTCVFAWWTFVSINRQVLSDADKFTVFGVSTLAAVGLFASLAAHDLVRLHVSRRLFGGDRPHKLLLFVVGGVSDIERSPRATPRSQAVAAIIAPTISLAAAITLVIGVAIASGPLPRDIDDLDRLGPPGILILELAAANAFVALVNLLPAYPLDGGRLLRAAIWRISGNVDRATRIATWTGQVSGFTLITLGIGGAVAAISAHAHSLWFMTAFVWLAFIGWFVASASAQGYTAETPAS